jgi:hypothetical protein
MIQCPKCGAVALITIKDSKTFWQKLCLMERMAVEVVLGSETLQVCFGKLKITEQLCSDCIPKPLYREN